MQIMRYKDIPNGRCFRLVEAERFGHPMSFVRHVTDIGVFVKIGNSHAVRVQAGMSQKTIIPGRDAKCSVLPGKIDTSHLSDWALVGQPYTTYKET